MKTTLLAVLSPAKLMDDQTHYPALNCSQPVFADEARKVALAMKKLSPADLQKLLAVSKPLAEQTWQQFQNWSLPFTHENAQPALLLFKGEVYRGLDAAHFDGPQLQFADKHLRILSGLYGLLRPLDLAMPYRLMMGTKFSPVKTADNLYTYWKAGITRQLQADLSPGGVLVNLASGEYFRAIDTARLGRKVIHCEFMEKKGSKLSIVSTYAKLARGMMASFMVTEKITSPADLCAFSAGGYAYQPKLSDEEHFIFTR